MINEIYVFTFSFLFLFVFGVYSDKPMQGKRERGVFIGHLTPVLSDEERLRGEGFNAQDMAGIYTAPGWGISMYSEHEDGRRRVGTIQRTWLNKEHNWLDVEVKFSLLHPESVQAYQDALDNKLFLSPSFQHPKPGTVTDPSQYYNCLREVSVTRDPYREGAVMVTCHNRGGTSVSRHQGSLKLVPNKCARGASSQVAISRHHRNTDVAMSAEQQQQSAPSATPSLDEIKKVIVGDGGKLTDESLRAAVVKFGVNNAPSIREMLADAIDFDDAETAKKNFADPEWKLNIVATGLHSLLSAKNKTPEQPDTEQQEDAMEEGGDGKSLFEQFYYEHQKANTEKISGAVKELMAEPQFKRFVTQLTAVANQPQFRDLTAGITKLASCGDQHRATEEPPKPSATHMTPAVTSHSAARARPSNPTDVGVQNALEMMKAAAKRRNDEACDIPVAKSQARASSSSAAAPSKRFVPDLD